MLYGTHALEVHLSINNDIDPSIVVYGTELSAEQGTCNCRFQLCNAISK